MKLKKKKIAEIAKAIIKRNITIHNFFVYILKFTKSAYEGITRHSLIFNYTDFPLEVIRIEGYKNAFCGYYDISPFCPTDNKKLLIHATNLPCNCEATTDISADVILYNRMSKETKRLDSVSTWNWQQGARTQWLSEELVAYNTLSEGNVRCVIANIRTGSKDILPVNLSIAYRDSFIVSIDYFALTTSSEYGYRGLHSKKNTEVIKRFDLKTGVITPLFSHYDLNYLSPMGSFRQHVNHLLVSPNGIRAVFIYRYWYNRKRFDSLVLYNFDTGTMNVLINNQTVSHYSWQDDNILLVWAIVNQNPGYFFVNVINSEIRHLNNSDDGHPNFLKKNIFITDIAGSSGLLASLTLYCQNMETSKRTNIVMISHPTVFNMATRCDMHVSVSYDKREFQIDSRHLSHNRAIIVGQIPPLP